jgi:hypothetical protein
MQIYPNGSDHVLPDNTQTLTPAASADGDAIRASTAAPSSVDRSVSISDAGRALARDSMADSVDPARASQIRERVLSGAYDSLEVVDALARRLLHSGDL